MNMEKCELARWMPVISIMGGCHKVENAINHHHGSVQRGIG
ncbi:MAG: hypothetical protein ACXQTR_01855 [Candidatus Methanospirareceae archaeon]